MSRETKLSVLGALLERVQKRAQSPRVAVPAIDPAPVVAKAPVMVAPAPAAAPPPPPERAQAQEPVKPIEEPVAMLSENDLISESVPPPREEPIEEGPPSAPRLREDAGEEPMVDDAEAEREPDVVTPPPESGRQEVAQAVSAEPAEALDMDIAITVSDSTPPPPPAPAPAEPGVAAPPSAPSPSAEVAAAPPRLALVSEPEIDLHRAPPTPLPPEPPPPAQPPPVAAPAPPPSDRLELIPESAPAAEASTAPAAAPEPVAARAPVPEPVPLPPPEEVELAVSIPDQPPARIAVSASAQEPVAEPPPSEPGLPAVSTPPPAPAPVRLMAAVPPLPTGESAAPVEVWASTHAAPSLRGQVASFVGQSASFAPKSFGELVDASLELGK